ncbi:hypothetical protein INR49_012216 [Caranx melampygus]|nr:hypothetical protein INR49_012216 [Caranx melampygus]
MPQQRPGGVLGCHSFLIQVSIQQHLVHIGGTASSYTSAAGLPPGGSVCNNYSKIRPGSLKHHKTETTAPQMFVFVILQMTDMTQCCDALGKLSPAYSSIPSTTIKQPTRTLRTIEWCCEWEYLVKHMTTATMTAI